MWFDFKSDHLCFSLCLMPHYLIYLLLLIQTLYSFLFSLVTGVKWCGGMCLFGLWCNLLCLCTKCHISTRWWAWYWSMQELPPFSLIFGLLFNFISPFFIATLHLYVVTLPHSSMSHLYFAALHHTPMSHLYTAPTLHHILPHIASRLALLHCHCLALLHMTCQVLRPSQATRSTTP